MKLAYVTAGAAGMYCGSCLHDNTLAAELIRLGHDVALIPVYTPIRTDEEDVSIDRVFYGAVNVYLEQKSALFRHTPWLVDRVLSNPHLLNWAASRGASSVDASDLGALTLSMLQGEEGKQAKELDRLIEWLLEFRPDMVHLTNSMLLGMARRIRQELGIPVICSLQGEDIFLDDLKEPWRARINATLRERAKDADGFFAPSDYYADHMAELLDVPRERIQTVRLGIKLAGFGTRGDREGSGPFVVGYLARICPEKGLHLLVESFRRLAETKGKERVRLRIAGYLGPRDQAYFAGIMEQVASWGLEEVVDHVGEIDRQQKIDFLDSLDVLSVPTIYREPKGIFVLEALASGVPVVQPRHGSFPEIIEATGGGLLVEPDSVEGLAEGLSELMEDPARKSALGRKGREAVHQDYNDEAMARNTLKAWGRYLE